MASPGEGGWGVASAAQKAMIEQMSKMNDRMQAEAAHQRDAHRSLTSRVDALSLGAQSFSGHAAEADGLPVPSTPPRAFRPLGQATRGSGPSAEADVDTIVHDTVADRTAVSHQHLTPEKKKRETSATKEKGRGGEASSSWAARPGKSSAPKSPEVVLVTLGAADPGEDPPFCRDPWLPPGTTPAAAAEKASAWTDYLSKRLARPVPVEGGGGAGGGGGGGGSQPRSQLAVAEALGGGQARIPPAAMSAWASPFQVTSAGRGQGGGDESNLLGRTAVIGPFPPRTRTSTAQADVFDRLKGMGLSHLFSEFPSTAPTSESISLRLTNWDAASWMVAAFRADRRPSAHSAGPLYCIRARG